MHRTNQRVEPACPSKVRRPSAILFAIIVAAGLILIGKGLYIHAKAAIAQVMLETSFEQSNGKPGPARPWPWADFTTEIRLGSDRLGVSDIVLSEAGGEALAFGPTHLSGTPLPGETGTAVIAAHRDTHFRWLKDLRPGDLLNVTGRDGNNQVFTVRSARIARNDASGIDANRQGVWMALATCWPFDAATPGPLRYIVETELLTTPANGPALALTSQIER